jgi:hypothetical protein
MRIEGPDRTAFPETAPLPEIGHVDPSPGMNGDVERLSELHAFVVFREAWPVVGHGRGAGVDGLQVEDEIGGLEVRIGSNAHGVLRNFPGAARRGRCRRPGGSPNAPPARPSGSPSARPRVGSSGGGAERRARVGSTAHDQGMGHARWQAAEVRDGPPIEAIGPSQPPDGNADCSESEITMWCPAASPREWPTGMGRAPGRNPPIRPVSPEEDPT